MGVVNLAELDKLIREIDSFLAQQNAKQPVPPDCADVVDRLALMRELLVAAQDIAAVAYEEPAYVDKALRRAEEILLRIKRHQAEETPATLASFERSWRFYYENFEALYQTYAGKYIALIDEQVVDSDTSFHELATRVYTKYGVRDMFMPKVERERTVRVSGPRRH